MNRGDETVEKGSARLRDLSRKAAARGGVAAKAARPLAEDATFLRKLKPSLILARARGQLPTNGTPDQPPAAPPGPQVPRRRAGKGGPNPFVVVGAALAVGILLAKAIDWRGHAHPNG
jgi:hypothetical protein